MRKYIATKEVSPSSINVLVISKNMRTPHTGTWEGKRVRVKLKNGTVFVDKFDGSKGKYRFFKEKGKVLVGEIASFIIWKGI